MHGAKWSHTSLLASISLPRPLPFPFPPFQDHSLRPSQQCHVTRDIHSAVHLATCGRMLPHVAAR